MCGAACGPKALESRSRKITQPSANGGVACPTSLVESHACGPACCAENCTVSMWSAWSACTVTCGRGLVLRTRTVTKAAVCEGTCLDDLQESANCTAPVACAQPAVDCEVSLWSTWSQCSSSCGAATRSRARNVRTMAANGGQPCPIDLSEVEVCSSPPCATTTVEVATTSTAPPATTTVGANGEVRVIASTDLAIPGGRNETLNVTIGGVNIKVTANPNNALLQDLPGPGLGVYSTAHGDDKAGSMRLRSGLEVVFRFKVPVAIKRILLGSWDGAVDRGLLVCSDVSRKRQTAPAPTELPLRNADTSFEAETANGFTRYVVQALNGSDFSILAFDFVVVERRTKSTKTTTTTAAATAVSTSGATSSDDGESNAIIPPETGGLEPLTLGLIIGGALLCVLLTLVAVGCIVARRRRTRGNSPYDNDDDDVDTKASAGTTRAGGGGNEMASARFDPMETASLRESTMLGRLDQSGTLRQSTGMPRASEYASTATMPFTAPTHEYGAAPPPIAVPAANTLRASATMSNYGAAPPIRDDAPPPPPPSGAPGGTLRRVPPPPPSSNYGVAPPIDYAAAPGTLRKARPPPPGGEYGVAPSL